MNYPVEQVIRVLIVDDRSPARLGLHALLDSIVQTSLPGCQEQASFVVVGEAENGQQALDLVNRLQPDVVLMDARMPGMDGLEATRRIKMRWPRTRVMILTLYADRRSEALAAGADAVVIKGCSPEALIHAIMTIEKESNDHE